MRFPFVRKSKPLRKIEKNLGLSYSSLERYLPLDDKISRLINELKTEYKLPEINTNVAKQDLMFINSLMDHSLNSTYKAYLKTGINARNIIAKASSAAFGNLSNINSILDFASGYGRLTRHLVHDINRNKIWVSDIKQSAIEFQMDEFGVNGVNSTYVPEEFNPLNEFDVIYVGSLFSHLPQDLFKRWLKKLALTLSENGILIFTTLNRKSHRPNSNLDFEYVENSEDVIFNFIEGSIKERGVYGMAFVSDDFMEEQIHSIKETVPFYYFHKNGLGKCQDVYVLSKKGCSELSLIDLSSYP